MPYKSKRPCASPGCSNLVEHGEIYCSKHKSNKLRSYTGAYKGAWQSLRTMYLKRNPLCEECKRKGIITVATEVDHIIPIKLRPDLRLEWTNLQSLCKSCHSKKTRSEN